MYSAGFYPFRTLADHWAYWSLHIAVNRYNAPVTELYRTIADWAARHDTFVITTNVDAQFASAGMADERIFAPQGDYGLFQCSRDCHQRTYPNRNTIEAMLKDTDYGRRTTLADQSLIPYCPVCGAPMAVTVWCCWNWAWGGTPRSGSDTRSSKSRGRPAPRLSASTPTRPPCGHPYRCPRNGICRCTATSPRCCPRCWDNRRTIYIELRNGDRRSPNGVFLTPVATIPNHAIWYRPSHSPTPTHTIRHRPHAGICDAALDTRRISAIARRRPPPHPAPPNTPTPHRTARPENPSLTRRITLFISL